MIEDALLEMLADNDRIFVILDAVDECPMERDDRDNVLAGVANLLKRKSDIHVLVTSRPEPDIASSLRDMAFHELNLRTSRSDISSDIDVFIRKTIDEVPRLRSLPPELREEIRQTLDAKADGMFQWVACQLDDLRRKRILKHSAIQKILRDLPADLDDTYDRILFEIGKDEEDMASEARTILQWIIFHHKGYDLWSASNLKTILADVCLYHSQEDLTMDHGQRSTLDIIFDYLSPLIRADQGRVELAHFTVQEYLLSARIKARGEHGSPLHTAIACGNWNTMRELLRLGADIHTEHRYLGSPLHHAVHTVNEFITSLDECVVTELVRAGANINARNAAGDTALHLICRDGVAITGNMEILLRHGADANSHGELGNTALHRACENQPVDATKMLIQAGADVKAFNSQGETPLHITCWSSDGHNLCKFLKVLLDAGADPNARRPDGATALHLLCDGDHEDHGAVGLLVSAGVELNTTWPQHGSPLQMAIARRNYLKVSTLLKNGVAIDNDSLWKFRYRSRHPRSGKGDPRTKWRPDKIRSHMCLALLRDAAAATSFQSVCGPPNLDNLLRWFLEIGTDGAGLLELINRDADTELILYVLQADIEVTPEHLRCYLGNDRGSCAHVDLDVVRALLQTGTLPDTDLVLHVMTKKWCCWPGVVEMLLEAVLRVDDPLMSALHENFDDGTSELQLKLHENGTEKLEIIDKAQEAQRQGQKYVPIYEPDAGVNEYGYPIWKRKAGM
ncbi:hypothetical protein AC579_7146 [Pseudocercospora musae]|uniref:Nephrocystin 3-like N-terminal domain-containing protein n=1 Tax=Pseudocercospora musae TaxID=113226 RepID=A0A139INC7_9PEZI|nr:hypothetical protein AC579_7146 [Pseudocercospora musae]